MKVMCGWASFFDPERREPVARGRVVVDDPPLPCPPSGPWTGEVALLRGFTSLRRRHREIWVLRFEGGGQDRWVELTSVERVWTRSGRRATAHIRTYDGRFPTELVELGGDG